MPPVSHGRRRGHLVVAGSVSIWGVADARRALRSAGSKAAPEVRVTGPGGQSLQTPAASGFVHAGAIRILRSEHLRVTGIGLQNARPGVYAIQPLPGSAPITSFGRASDPPNARVAASVRGTGTHRVLVYDVRRRPNQRVTFAEVGAGGSSRTIGTVAGGGRGELHFSPAPGRGTRRIVAQFELAGIPAETRTVARFTPPAPQLATPRGAEHPTLRRHPARPVVHCARRRHLPGIGDPDRRAPAHDRDPRSARHDSRGRCVRQRNRERPRAGTATRRARRHRPLPRDQKSADEPPATGALQRHGETGLQLDPLTIPPSRPAYRFGSWRRKTDTNGRRMPARLSRKACSFTAAGRRSHARVRSPDERRARTGVLTRDSHGREQPRRCAIVAP